MRIVYEKVSRVLLGRQLNDGLLFKTFVYVLLVSIGFVYLYPLFYIISRSFMSLADLLDPTIMWIPGELYFENFVRAFYVLDYQKSIWASMLTSILPAIAQTVSCAFIGYGFAKYRFPGKTIMLGLMMIIFIIPSQVIMIPSFMLFENLGILGSPLPLILPALFGQGLKSVLFILIYMQFFKTVPIALEEAAQIDGSGFIRTFTSIVIPISAPAIVVVFLFSLVWHWNETYLMSLYLGNSMSTLPLQLKSFNDAYMRLYSSVGGGPGNDINESIRMAGTFLIIAPMLVLYLFAQKWFVQVVDKTGIAGE